MQINFYKYQGAGNDFILIDNRENLFDKHNHALIQKLCDRRFGVGADGLMLVEQHEKFDFEMIYYNSDGHFGSMCGNGGRCIVSFAKKLNIFNSTTKFLASDGEHFAKILNEKNWISLQMIDVYETRNIDNAYIINTGSPHYISFNSNVSELDVYSLGHTIRNQPEYKKEGINVNFVEDLGNKLFVRTYERGVENETLACGTGVTAAALAYAQKNGLKGNQKIEVKVMGGQLQVEFSFDGNTFTNIYLNGPAEYVFEGLIEI